MNEKLIQGLKGLKEGRYKKAMALLAEYLKSSDGKINIISEFISLHEEKAPHPSKYLTRLRELVAQGGDQKGQLITLYSALAHYEFREVNYGRARKLFSYIIKLIQFEPTFDTLRNAAMQELFDITKVLGDCQYRAGKADIARKLFSKAIQIYDDISWTSKLDSNIKESAAKILLHYGVIELAARNYVVAIRLFERSIACYNHLDILGTLKKSPNQTQKSDELLIALEDLTLLHIAHFPSIFLTQLYNALGIQELKNKCYAEAITLFSNAKMLPQKPLNTQRLTEMQTGLLNAVTALKENNFTSCDLNCCLSAQCSYVTTTVLDMIANMQPQHAKAALMHFASQNSLILDCAEDYILNATALQTLDIILKNTKTITHLEFGNIKLDKGIHECIKEKMALWKTLAFIRLTNNTIVKYKPIAQKDVTSLAADVKEDLGTVIFQKYDKETIYKASFAPYGVDRFSKKRSDVAKYINQLIEDTAYAYLCYCALNTTFVDSNGFLLTLPEDVIKIIATCLPPRDFLELAYNI